MNLSYHLNNVQHKKMLHLQLQFMLLIFGCWYRIGEVSDKALYVFDLNDHLTFSK